MIVHPVTTYLQPFCLPAEMPENFRQPVVEHGAFFIPHTITEIIDRLLIYNTFNKRKNKYFLERTNVVY